MWEPAAGALESQSERAPWTGGGGKREREGGGERRRGNEWGKEVEKLVLEEEEGKG